MAISKLSIVCIGLMLASALPAVSADENGRPGTVNYFTAAQQTRAFGAASQSGYTPTIVEAFQDGNFFLTARKGEELYEVTVTASGQVYPSTPLTPSS